MCDKAEQRPSLPRRLTWIGDSSVILLFAAVGRASHNSDAGGPIAGTILVAAPFLAGWYVGAAVTGAHNARSLRDFRTCARTTAAGWILGSLIGLGIRSVAERRIVPAGFAIVTVLFNAAFLLGWRLLALYAAKLRSRT